MKQSYSLLIFGLNVAFSAYPTVLVEKHRLKHNTQVRTKLPHTANKTKENMNQQFNLKKLLMISFSFSDKTVPPAGRKAA